MVSGRNGEREMERDAQARSVEAMVMSIGFGSKLRVLERISPPLPAASFPSSAAADTVVGGSDARVGGRGPVIAIEGPDAWLVRGVAAVVERVLKAASPAEDGWEVRCWEDESGVGGGLSRVDGGAENVVMVESGVGGPATSRHGSLASIISTTSAGDVSAANINPFTAYLRAINDWHAKSAEIVSFVTGASSPSPSTTTTLTPTGPNQARLSTSSATTTTTTSSLSSSTDPNKTEPEPEPETGARNRNNPPPAPASPPVAPV